LDPSGFVLQYIYAMGFGRHLGVVYFSNLFMVD